MRRYDPKQIVDNLRALDAPSERPSLSETRGSETTPERNALSDRQKKPAPDEKSPERASRTPSGNAPGEIALPEFPAELFYDRILPVLKESVDIAAVPPGTRLRFAKTLIQRFLRIISGKQVNFNHETTQALWILAEHARQGDEALQHWAEHSRQVDEALHHWAEHARQGDEALHHWAEHARQGDEALQDLRRLIVQDIAQKLQEAQQKLLLFESRSVEQKRLQEQVLELSAKLSAEGEARMRRMLHLFLQEVQKLPTPPARSSTGGGEHKPPPSASSPERAASLAEDYSYLLYEDAWRGSKEQIRAWQEEYAAWIESQLNALPAARRRVLDVGCGRGEFLALLKERGVEALGVELNEMSAKIGLEDGLDIEVCDAMDFLEKQPDDSFGAIVAFQVVEHFSPAALRRFLDLVFAKLAPGGGAAFETPNPGTFAAYRWYFMDPTHQSFLPPETLRFVCECAGLEHLETRMLHPVPDYLRLQPTGDEAQRENIRLLNDLLFGPQDYCILARKPV